MELIAIRLVKRISDMPPYGNCFLTRYLFNGLFMEKIIKYASIYACKIFFFKKEKKLQSNCSDGDRRCVLEALHSSPCFLIFLNP